MEYMHSITKKQKKLLTTISNYRSQYGKPPTLREMAKNAHISDVKSVHRMIQALVLKGYLYHDRMKSRGVLLTGFGINEVESLMLSKQLKTSPSSIDNHKKQSELAGELSRNDVTVSLPTSNSIIYGNKNIKANGTNISTDLQNIVEAVVNIVIDKFANGSTFNNQQEKHELASNITNFITRISTQDYILQNLGWLAILIIGFFAYTKIIDDHTQAFLYASFSVFIVNLLIRKGNL